MRTLFDMNRVVVAMAALAMLFVLFTCIGTVRAPANTAGLTVNLKYNNGTKTSFVCSQDAMVLNCIQK